MAFACWPRTLHLGGPVMARLAANALTWVSRGVTRECDPEAMVFRLLVLIDDDGPDQARTGSISDGERTQVEWNQAEWQARTSRTGHHRSRWTPPRVVPPGL
jgi:hypothetical protein